MVPRSTMLDARARTEIDHAIVARSVSWPRCEGGHESARVRDESGYRGPSWSRRRARRQKADRSFRGALVASAPASWSRASAEPTLLIRCGLGVGTLAAPVDVCSGSLVCRVAPKVPIAGRIWQLETTRPRGDRGPAPAHAPAWPPPPPRQLGEVRARLTISRARDRVPVRRYWLALRSTRAAPSSFIGSDVGSSSGIADAYPDLRTRSSHFELHWLGRRLVLGHR